MPDTPMTTARASAQVGQLLYRANCIIAALIASFGIWLYVTDGRTHSSGFYVLGVFLVMATIAWCLGRLSRYVLAGH
jgi:hypothetical protein